MPPPRLLCSSPSPAGLSRKKEAALEGPLPKPAMALLSAVGGAAQRRGFHRRFLTGAGRPAYRLGLLPLAFQVPDPPDYLLHRWRRDAIRLAGAVAAG